MRVDRCIADPPRDVFDRAGFMERALGDADLAETLINAFLDDTPQRLASIRSHLSRQERERAKSEAHAIKGAAGMVGAEGIKAAAARLESNLASITSIPEPTETLLHGLDRQLLRFRKTVAQFSDAT